MAQRPISTAAQRLTSQWHEGRQAEKGWIYLAHARRRFGDGRGVGMMGTWRRRPRHLLLPSTSASSPSPLPLLLPLLLLLPFSSLFSFSFFFLFLLFLSPLFSSFFFLLLLPSSSYCCFLLLLPSRRQDQGSTGAPRAGACMGGRPRTPAVVARADGGGSPAWACRRGGAGVEMSGFLASDVTTCSKPSQFFTTASTCDNTTPRQVS